MGGLDTCGLSLIHIFTNKLISTIVGEHEFVFFSEDATKYAVDAAGNNLLLAYADAVKDKIVLSLIHISRGAFAKTYPIIRPSNLRKEEEAMSRPTTLRASRSTIVLNKVKTFFSKPHNVILLLLGIVLTFTTVAPIVAIVEDTFKIHAGTIDAHLTGQATGYTTVNYTDLFTSRMAKRCV